MTIGNRISSGESMSVEKKNESVPKGSMFSLGLAYVATAIIGPVIGTNINYFYEKMLGVPTEYSLNKVIWSFAGLAVIFGITTFLSQ